VGVTEFDGHVENGCGFLKVGFGAVELVFLDLLGEVPLQDGDEEDSGDQEEE
jgi:hypothetical protein